jgi:hypothetical protein
MKRALFFFIALAVSGCSPQYSDFFPYHDDGTPKPYVAFVPIISECKSEVPWDVTRELTNDMRREMMKHGKLFLSREADIQKQLAACSKKDLTSSDLMPSLYFQPAHFVVVLELVEHRQVPYERGKIKPLYLAYVPNPEDAYVLMMKIRVKIVDIRGGEPKLIRQEMILSNHVMQKDALKESIALWGKKGYLSSPLGIAHARFVRDVVEKIERITSYQRS